VSGAFRERRGGYRSMPDLRTEDRPGKKGKKEITRACRLVKRDQEKKLG